MSGTKQQLEEPVARRRRRTAARRREFTFPIPARRVRREIEERASLLALADPPTARRDSARRRLLALVDAFGMVLAFALAFAAVRPQAGLADWAPLLAAVPLWVLVHKLLGLYDRDDKVIHKSTLDELPRLLHSLTLGTLLLYTFAPAVAAVSMSRTMAAVFWISLVIVVPILRVLVRYAVMRAFTPERCLIVGSGLVAGMLARKIEANPQHGLQLVGFIDDESERPALIEAPQLLGSVANFEAICAQHGVERVLVAFSDGSHHGLIDVVRLAKRGGIKISVVPRLYEVIGHSLEVDQVEGMTMLTLRGLGRSRSSLLLKRAIDVVGASLGLLLCSPLLIVIAVAVRLTSPGPVLYSATRMGRHTPFRMHKFRSMVTGADALKADLQHLNEADGPMFKIAADPRLTRIGSFLRRTSLDELPQLFNVLRGEMSLVGPRPLVPDEDDQIVGLQRARLDLTPGLTGPWQVAGRTKVPFYEMVTMDYLYVAEWSLFNDIKLLMRTLPVVLFARGH